MSLLCTYQLLPVNPVAKHPIRSNKANLRLLFRSQRYQAACVGEFKILQNIANFIKSYAFSLRIPKLNVSCQANAKQSSDVQNLDVPIHDKFYKIELNISANT